MANAEEFVSTMSGTSYFLSLGAAAVSAPSWSPPEGLSWPTTVNGKPAPQKVGLRGSNYVSLANDGSEYDPKILVPDEIFSVAPTFTDMTRADNTGNATSLATAKRDINAAITLANGDGQAAQYIDVLANDFGHQTRTINGGTAFPNGVQPTKPAAIVATGGRVRHIAGTAEASWVSAGGGVYTGGPSSFVLAYDRLLLDQYGSYTEITARADQAAVTAAAEGITDIGTTLAIKRLDGLMPTTANTLILRVLNVAAFNNMVSALYVKGFDFEGGQFGAKWLDPIATRNCVFSGCTFKYSGEPLNTLDASRDRRTNGLLYYEDCEASRAWKDGFSHHQDDATASAGYVFNIRGKAWSNGRGTSTSNNAFTTHDTIIAWVTGLVCGDSYVGSDFHCIENTKTYALGCNVKSTSRGGVGNAAVKASNSAIIWLENCVIEAPAGQYALHAQGGKIYHRNCTIIGETLADGGTGQIIPVTGNWPALS